MVGGGFFRAREGVKGGHGMELGTAGMLYGMSVMDTREG